jgi:hypothetical protein
MDAMIGGGGGGGGRAAKTGLTQWAKDAAEMAAAARAAEALAADVRMLAAWAQTKGNFGAGVATRSRAQELAELWVGNGYRARPDGILISKDGTRQYRPPQHKAKWDAVQASFEWRQRAEAKVMPNGQIVRPWQKKGFQGNAHLEISDP